MDVISDKTSARNFAMGKFEAGSVQRNIAQELGYDISTIRRWWEKYKNGETLGHRKGAGLRKS